MERYIGLDVHAASTTAAVIDARGKRVGTPHVLETHGKVWVEFFKLQPGTLHVCLEEGTQSAWLAEILSPHVSELVVVHVSASRGPKDDARDAHALAERLRELDRDIHRTLERHEVGTLLTTIDGIGSTTAARLVAELGDIAQFGTLAVLAAYVGVVPGFEHLGKRTTGHAALRAKLWMPTLRAVRSNAWLRAFYDGLRARGKLPKVALIAAMRKLLAAVLSVAKHRRPSVLQLDAATGRHVERHDDVLGPAGLGLLADVPRVQAELDTLAASPPSRSTRSRSRSGARPRGPNRPRTAFACFTAADPSAVNHEGSTATTPGAASPRAFSPAPCRSRRRLPEIFSMPSLERSTLHRAWTLALALAACGGSGNAPRDADPDHSLGDAAADVPGDRATGPDAAKCAPWTTTTRDAGTCAAGGPGPTGAATTTADLGDGFRVVRNLSYGTRGGRVLQGDLFLPPRDGRTPGVLVVVHGGGWADCERRRAATDWYAAVMSRLLRVATFNVEYRLVQEGGAYPANLGDVKCAIQWLGTHAAEHGADGARIAVAGESAGAHLALMAGVTQGRDDLDPGCGPAPPRVAGVVAFSAPTDLPRFVADGTAAGGAATAYAGPCTTPVAGCERAPACDRCVDASPVAHACDAAGRFVLVQAVDPFDPLVPQAQAQRLADALRAGGAAVDLVMVGDARLRAEGCEPGHLDLRTPHGLNFGQTCLTTPSGPAVTALLGATIAPR